MKRLILIMLAISTLLWAEKPKPNTVIGKIQDRVYTWSEYESILNNYLAYHGARQAKPLTAEDKARLNDQCWEELVGRYIYDQAIAAGKIKLTNAELLAEAKKNPPDGVEKLKDLQTNGKFDKKKYEKALSEVPDFRKSVLDAVRSVYQYTKLLSVIRGEVDVSADSVRAAWMKDNDTVDARVIVFDYNKLTHVTATDDEVLRFFEERREEYKREDGRTFRYVQFSKSPSREDSLATHIQMLGVYKRLQEGADFSALAAEYSQDPGSAQNGGNLGWFKRGQMVPEFENASFSTPPGQLAEPVLSRFGWHIIMVDGKREGDSGTEVSARHILFRFEPGEATLQNMKLRSTELYNKAREKGLVKAAAEMNMEVKETAAFFPQDTVIREIGREPRLVLFALENPSGTLADLYYSSSGDAFVLEVAGVYPVWYPRFEDEKANITSRATNTKRMYMMDQYTRNFMEQTKASDFFLRAEHDTLMVVEVKKLKSDAPISSIGKVAAINQALFATAKGAWTDLIEDNKRWYLGYVDDRQIPDPKLWEKTKSTVIAEARKEKQQKHLNDWYFAQRQKITVIDNRADYYDLSSIRKLQQIRL